LKVAIVKDNLEKVLHLDFPSEGLSWIKTLIN
jgi:hypothetical protein